MYMEAQTKITNNQTPTHLSRSSEWNSEANRASVGTGCNFQYEPNSSHLLFHDEIRRGTGGPDPHPHPWKTTNLKGFLAIRVRIP